METSCPSLPPQSPNSHALVQIKLADTPQKYKPSRYNAHTIAEDESMVLYNSFTGNTCVIPESGLPEAKQYLSQNGVEGPLGKIGDYLLKKGYLVEAEVDEGARWEMRYNLQQFRPDLLELILLTSEECNFRCVYCSQSFSRGTMTSEIRAGVRKFVEKRIKKLQSLRIAWFGGEPLLGYEAMEELGPFFKSAAAKYDVPYTSDITTNGYLLTYERSRALLDWGVTIFQISLDGTMEDHDKHRPLKGGGSTFQQVLENLQALKSHPDPYIVYVRANFDNTNVQRLTPFIEMMRDCFHGDPRFQVRFHPVGKWGGPNDDQLDVCGTRDTVQHMLQLRQQARGEGVSSEQISPYIVPDPKNVCFAARPYSFVVGADGKLMKCTEVLDTNPTNIVGRLTPDGETILDQDIFAKWIKPYYKEDHMCTKCFFVPVCQGAICVLPRVIDGTRPCPSYKTEIRETLLEVRREKLAAREGKSIRLAAK